MSDAIYVTLYLSFHAVWEKHFKPLLDVFITNNNIAGPGVRSQEYFELELFLKVKSDHRSKYSNLSNGKEEAWKNEASTRFETVTFAIPVRCSTNWAMKPHNGERGQFIEFISSRAVSSYHRIWQNLKVMRHFLVVVWSNLTCWKQKCFLPKFFLPSSTSKWRHKIDVTNDAKVVLTLQVRYLAVFFIFAPGNTTAVASRLIPVKLPPLHCRIHSKQHVTS